MLKKFSLLLMLLLVLTVPFAASAQDDAAPIYYWISHGSPADPVWT